MYSMYIITEGSAIESIQKKFEGCFVLSDTNSYEMYGCIGTIFNSIKKSSQRLNSV